jgi:hypothetical protein
MLRFACDAPALSVHPKLSLSQTSRLESPQILLGVGGGVTLAS